MCIKYSLHTRTRIRNAIHEAWIEFRGGLNNKQTTLCLLLAIALIAVNIFNFVLTVQKYNRSHDYPDEIYHIQHVPLREAPDYYIVIPRTDANPTNIITLLSNITCVNTALPSTSRDLPTYCHSIHLPESHYTPLFISSEVASYTPVPTKDSFYIGSMSVVFNDEWVKQNSNNLTFMLIVAGYDAFNVFIEEFNSNPNAPPYKPYAYIDATATVTKFHVRDIDGTNEFYPNPNNFLYSFRGYKKLDETKITYIPIIRPSFNEPRVEYCDFQIQPDVLPLHNNEKEAYFTIQVEEEVANFEMIQVLSSILSVFNISLTIFAFAFPTIILAYTQRRFVLDKKMDKQLIKHYINTYNNTYDIDNDPPSQIVSINEDLAKFNVSNNAIQIDNHFNNINSRCLPNNSSQLQHSNSSEYVDNNQLYIRLNNTNSRE